MSEGSMKGKHHTTKYETDILPHLSDISEWVSQGDSVRTICKKLVISPDTWYKCCKEHENLTELIELSKNLLNNEVERSLFRLCTGYEYEEIKTIVEEDTHGKKHTRIEKAKKHQPPSASAISFFLRNRCPADWTEKKELILNTSQNENDRKKLFLQMLSDENPVEVVGYEIIEENEQGEDLDSPSHT